MNQFAQVSLIVGGILPSHGWLIVMSSGGSQPGSGWRDYLNLSTSPG